jgi:ankyrin repeat protein
MHRKLTPRSSLDNLKREATRWLKALRAHDPEARARLERAYPDAPLLPALRDVQHALAREHGLAGWMALKSAVAGARWETDPTPRETVIQEFLAAAASGDTARIVVLLDRHPDIIDERAVLRGHTGRRTALHFAVGGTHEPVVALLLERGANPNVRDEGDDAMPLHFAAEKEHLGIIRLLVEHGADPIGEGTYHELDVLGWATCFGTGRRDVVDYLVAHGAQYTIFAAVAMGEVGIVRSLVARSPADLERRMDETNRRRTPLHLAVVRKQAAMVATLLDLGGDPVARDAAGLTPLDQAALAGEMEMARLFLERGTPIELPTAVALQLTGDIERLLGEDPGCLRPGGRWGTLIIRASEQASAHVIETLLRAGASVDVRDDSRTSVDSTAGYTPLHAAAFRGNGAAVAVLLAHGADVNARETRYCATPAGWADYAGHREVRDLILAGPIDLFEAIAFDLGDRIPDILERDPAALERPFGAYVICDSAADPWKRGPWRTPLAAAVAENRIEAVRLLLERGADATVRAPDGRSLAEFANERGLETIGQLLRTAIVPHRGTPIRRE